MTALAWHTLGGDQLAAGDDWMYVIAHDGGQAVLTRYLLDAADHADVARQAALNAIQLGGAYGAVPEALPPVLDRLKQAAQQYESGIDIAGHRAWWHGYVPEGS